ncbi:MAG: rhomboid family intramembrane serine protease [Treponema sp.]|uniref:rhomboid family intramembrane serine protease n=1 Tax=Treponema sp. TaxID=166 RepID=UPI00298E898B|nr:rhomboid family intramembrane serine protease [Treponema sp.]MBR0155198.1 rhomboid family intramembrane serine protease [Treponema sp.]MCR5386812.1 rhomboid family intramembrane serine protease [Treponema sp.]
MTNILQKRFRYTFFNATIIIAAINVFVFFLTKLFPDLYFVLGLNPYAFINSKMYWQILTCVFVHGSFRHLAFNMFGLVMFGINVERSVGSKEFLLYYLLCGILTSLFSVFFYIFKGQYYVLLVGASGAIFSILFAFAVIFPTVRVFIFGLIPVPGPVLVLIYTIVELTSQYFGFDTGVAHVTHLLGFAFAWLYFIVRFGVNPVKIWINAFRR